MLTPEQQQALSGLISGLGPQAQESFGQFLQPKGPKDYQDIFQQSYVQPAQKALEQQILPSIQQRFVDLDAGSSSALNQALAGAASDVATNLGSQYGNFYQNQQTLSLDAIKQFLPLLTNHTFSPLIQQRQGLAGPALGALGSALGGASKAFGGF